MCGSGLKVKRKLTDFFHHHPHMVKFLLDMSPIDNSRFDDVIQLEDNQTIGKIAIQMMYKW